MKFNTDIIYTYLPNDNIDDDVLTSRKSNKILSFFYYAKRRSIITISR